jgi:hypothetical protein
MNFKQFKYFKTDFQGIIIIVEPSPFIWFKNKTGSILGTLPEIPLMWGSQTTFQECNVASVILDTRRRSSFSFLMMGKQYPTQNIKWTMVMYL